MVQINFATREVSCKIVYYGPGLCGKTTNLQQVHTKAPTELRGNLTSIATEGDRTLFFDFMPMELGTVAGMRTKLQLYTVPGQVYYNATRKIVLEGVDGIVFVADSSPARRQANRDSWQNLKENLHEYGLDLRDVPVVLQFNKRDLPDALPTGELAADLNELGAPTFEAVAVTGDGVMPTLRQLTAMVLERLNEQRSRRPRSQPAPAPQRTATAPTAAPAPAAARTAAAVTGPAAGPAPAERRAESEGPKAPQRSKTERVAEPVVAREGSPGAAPTAKPGVERPAAKPAEPPVATPRAAEPKVGAPKAAEPKVAAPKVVQPKAPLPKMTPTKVAETRPGRAVQRSGAREPGARRAAAGAGRPEAGGPVSRPRFTLADRRRKAPSRKKALVILGVLAIVVVVLLLLLVRGR
jgi:signal recognition particle receptor subunit beta